MGGWGRCRACEVSGSQTDAGCTSMSRLDERASPLSPYPPSRKLESPTNQDPYDPSRVRGPNHPWICPDCMPKKKKAYIETYGCQMNISDSELMQGILAS